MFAGPEEFELGSDYVGDLTGVAFDGVPGTAGASVAWTLYDAAETPVASGTGTFVSAGAYRITVPASAFAAQVPNPSRFRHTAGRIAAAVTQGGVSGSFGSPVRFVWPTPSAT